MTKNFPDPFFVEANGVRFALYEADGDPELKRPPIFLIHGWPELAFSWRNQLHAFASAGFRVIAPDLKGFGLSDAPKDPALYDMEHLTGDLSGLLDALDIDKAIFCGHDWGGAVVWSMAQWAPDRTAGVIGVCTPLHPRPPVPPLTIIEQRFSAAHYFVQFQEAAVPEALFESDIERFFQTIFQKPAPREKWPSLIPKIYDLPGRFKAGKIPPPEMRIASDAEIQRYVDAYRRSGFHGGINLYRNIDRNWEMTEGRDETVNAPALWLGAELDLFLPPETAEGMEDLIPDLEKHIISDCGHWVMWEKPEVLNELAIDWLTRRFQI